MNMLSLITKSRILIFFLIQSNPFLYYLYGLNLGIGAGSQRAVLYTVAFFLVLSLTLVSSRNRSILSQPIPGSLLFLSIFSFLSCALQGLRGAENLLVYYFPLYEYVATYFLCIVVGPRAIHDFFVKQLPAFAIVLFSFSASLWLYSTFASISFGVFRANIGGIVLNRWPDFINPVFAVVAAISYPSPVLIIVAILFAAITLYRTVMVASLSSFFLAAAINLIISPSRFTGKLNYTLILATLSLMLLPLYFLSSQSNYSTSGSFDLPSILSLALQRFISIFSPDQNDMSGAARVGQFFPLLDGLLLSFQSPLNLFLGSDPIVGSDHAYNYAFYPLSSLILFGLPVVSIISFQILISVKSFSANIRLYVSLSLHVYVIMLASLMVFLILFPYMTQYPIASLFALCNYMLSIPRRQLTACPLPDVSR